MACTSHTLPIVAPLTEVTVKQRFRYRSLIGSPTLPVLPESLGKTDPISVQVSYVHV
jgi:hypothetical protein